MTRSIHLWRLSDGRPGHDNQSLGLVEALARLVPIDALTIKVNGAWHGARQVLGQHGSRPAILIGAGHATHGGLLIGAWRHRARSIVLMNPSLPCALFGLCIVPEHDGVRPRANVLQSLGALNRVQVNTQRDAKLALILLGGPSRHCPWDQDALITQIRELVSARTSLRWLIASSPRTPAQTMLALRQLETVRLVRFEDTSTDWLPKKLAQASLIWVTEDSMSMAYEALSSGAPTGLLAVGVQERIDKQRPSMTRSTNRLAAAVQALRGSGRIISTQQWLAGQELLANADPLREADRCAQKILDRWPNLG